jgi:hypothetical protein
MARFQCLRSGNFIELTEQDDIRNMVSNESYKEVICEVQVENTVKTIESDPGDTSESQDDEDGKEDGNEGKEEGYVLARRGRPRKVR